MEKKRTKVLKAAMKEERVKYKNLENELANANAQVAKLNVLLADKDKRYQDLSSEKMSLEETVIKL